MKAAVFCVVALLALACLANAQTPKVARNATALANETEAPTMGTRVRNATATAVGAARNATMTRKNATMMNETMESPAPKDAAPAASPPPAKKSGAVVATTGFAAAVAGSVVLLQLVL